MQSPGQSRAGPTVVGHGGPHPGACGEGREENQFEMWSLGAEGREHRGLRWKTLEWRARCQGSGGALGSLVWASHHLQPLFLGSRPAPGLSPPEARGADTLVTGHLLVGSPNTWELVPEEDTLPLRLYVVCGINKLWGGEGLFLIVAMLTPEP